jgi:phenylalanyl-tRNA synthetase beta chain
MNISHEWLKAFVPHAMKAEKVADLLTAHVATVDGIERTRAELEPFVVAQVVASEKIPDTRLSFNKVDDGSGTLLEVVCGAPNVTVGAKYPFARSGTTMPAGFKIELKKIRGFTSNGMLCSPRELGLGDDHDGIMTLDTKAAPGTPFLDVLPLGDSRIVVDVLPNRPDLLSHIGVARELSALTGKPLKLPAELAGAPKAPKAVRGNSSVKAGGVSVKMHDWSDCGRYVGVVIRGVKVGPSPDWLRQRVESVGGRSISNVVDATNYILHGYGQPVHAFDLGKLGGSAIVVRRAKTGESITTLDGTQRKLDPSVLVIADASVPTAIAGIMGGKASEVTEATTDILLEVATFTPKVVRAGRKLLGMNTDASYRYERGIDDAAVPSVALIAAGLIAKVASGTIETVLDAGFVPKPRKAVPLNPARVGKLLGDKVPAAETVKLLKSIGFAVAKSGASLKVTPPSWRHDVSRDVDLIEDVARLRGYDKLPDEITGTRPGTVPDHPLHTMSGRIRSALVARGLLEARPSPYTAGTGKPLVRVINPLGDDEPFLRDSLLHTLGRRAEYNLSRMNGDVRLFEIGTAFMPAQRGIVREEMRVGAIVMGARRPRHFSEPAPPAIDAWDAKGIAESIVSAAWPGAEYRLDAEGVASPVLWCVIVNGAEVGTVESVALDAPVWASAAFGVEITLGEMSAAPVAPRGKHNYRLRDQGSGAWVSGSGSGVASPVRFRPMPSTPAAVFDLALIVPDAVQSAKVAETLRRTAGETLESVVVFDEYRGEGVPAGSRSLAWQLTFRHPERTLSAKEIEGRRAQLIKTLQQELGIVVRAN